ERRRSLRAPTPAAPQPVAPRRRRFVVDLGAGQDHAEVPEVAVARDVDPPLDARRLHVREVDDVVDVTHRIQVAESQLDRAYVAIALHGLSATARAGRSGAGSRG